MAALGAFVAIERRSQQPITPLRLFASLRRSGSYLARLFLVAGMFGMFFFLTQFVQDILGLSPLLAGVAFLPMTLTVFGVSRAAPRLLPRFGAGRVMLAGMLPVIAGMAWLAQVGAGSSYLGGILGPMLLLGSGMGLVFVPLTTLSLAGVAREDSGAASSMVNVTQQVGGSLGLAILVTVLRHGLPACRGRGGGRDRGGHGAPRADPWRRGGLHGRGRVRRGGARGDPADRAAGQPTAGSEAGGGGGTGQRQRAAGQQREVTARSASPAGTGMPGCTITAVPPCCRAASGRPSARAATTVAPLSRARSSSTV